MARNLKAIENYRETISNEPEYDGEYRIVNHNPYGDMKPIYVKVKDDIQVTKKPEIKVLVNFKKKES